MNPRLLIAGLLGLFGGIKGIGGAKGAGTNVPRPSVDDICGNKPSNTKHKHKVRFGASRSANNAARLKRHRWQIEKASRKKNYARNGTRG